LLTGFGLIALIDFVTFFHVDLVFGFINCPALTGQAFAIFGNLDFCPIVSLPKLLTGKFVNLQPCK
jgi:hypothetical protein